MAKQYGWSGLAGVFNSDPPKSPWGSGGGDRGDKAGEKPGGSEGGGPRNPWSVPPGARRPGRGPGSTLDELLRRARFGGGGGGSGGLGGGFSGAPLSPRLWVAIAGALILLWVGFTSFHAISTQERGVVTTLGRYSGTLQPGISFTLPAPFTQVEVIDVQGIRTENFPETGNGENLMLTGDQNVIDLNYSVRWNIADAPAFAFQIADPEATVRAASETAMRAVIATTTLNEAISSGGGQIAAKVQIAIQQILDDYQSGIRIQGVAINKRSAPQAVDAAFKDVSAAQQEAQGARNTAQGYAQQVIANAQGEAAEFDKIYEQYRLAPEVTRRRLYYETIEQVLQRNNKVVIDSGGVNSYLPLPDLLRRGTPPNGDITVQGNRPAQGGNR